MKKIIFLNIFIALLFFPGIADLYGSGFYLINKEEPLTLYIEGNENTVVNTAAGLFADDIQLISGVKPIVTNSIKNARLIAGTVGSTPEFDRWLKNEGISTEGISGEWEAFRIEVIQKGEEKPLLLVLGSDERGTAYGLLELSRMIGVSPWYWWADAVPVQKNSFILPVGFTQTQKPSVQYRGIFINDEDWGFLPWSKNTFEPEAKTSLGVKTYEKVFEFLLRLRANMLWPAMHGVSTPFYFIDGAKETADKYGIVIGTSHCEPLMRNTNGEWKVSGVGEYNYLTNKDHVTDFWKERLTDVKQYENIYTIGMRGVHDGKMQGAETIDEQMLLLNEAVRDQRDLLSGILKTDITKIPQVFMPYKEVLDIYNNGLQVPDDVTLIWCDDNYGYITKLSNEEEQKRKGGSGVYYHVSYFGKPHDYLWLCSTQPALIYTEMKQAWDYGARKLWILNAGDIKPAEYQTEFFLDLAWDINSINHNTIYEHQEKWLEREFGTETAKDLNVVINEYYRLAGIRKPEHMGFNRTQEYALTKRSGGATDVEDTAFNPFMFGDELQKRADAYSSLEKIVLALEDKIPDNKKDAYFELVKYPVLAAKAMNIKMLYAHKARLFYKYNLLVSNEYAEESRNAYNQIIDLTVDYNKVLANGKWDGMMDMQPRKLPVFDAPVLPQKIEMAPDSPATVWMENFAEPLPADQSVEIPMLISECETEYFISLFSKSPETIEWSVENVPAWLNIKEQNTGFLYEKKLLLSVDRSKNKKNDNAEIQLIVDGQSYKIQLQTNIVSQKLKTESNGMIAWNASSFEQTGNTKAVQGLGHSMNAVILPKGEELIYEVYTTNAGTAKLTLAFVPGHAVNGRDLRYQISIDGESPQTISLKREIGSDEWKESVLRSQLLKPTYHNIDQMGKHTIRIKALDDNIIVDQLMLDFDLERKYYQIPVNK